MAKKKKVGEAIEAILQAYERARQTEDVDDDMEQFYLLQDAVNAAQSQGINLEFDYKTYNTPEALIENLRMQLDQKRMGSKIQTAKCKCGKGGMGRLGKRDPNNGLIEVKLKKGKNGVIKCYDIGIGQAPENTEVIAYVPSKSQIGFVDYKK